MYARLSRGKRYNQDIEPVNLISYMYTLGQLWGEGEIIKIDRAKIIDKNNGKIE